MWLKWWIIEEKTRDFCLNMGVPKRKRDFCLNGVFAKTRDFRVKWGILEEKTRDFHLNGGFS